MKKQYVITAWSGGCAVSVISIILAASVFAQAPEKDAPANRVRNVVVSKYAELPRLTYRMLQNDHDFLKGEKFQGAIYPVKILKMPAGLGKTAGADMRLVRATIANRKHSLYVIIPKNAAIRVSELARKKKVLSLVYTPVGVYGGLPLIKLIEESDDDPAGSISADFFKTGIAQYFPAPKDARWTIAVGKDIRLLEYEVSEILKGKARGIRRESIPGRPDSEKMTPFIVEYSANSITVSVEARDGMERPVLKSDVLIRGPLKNGTRWISAADGVERQREIISTNETVMAGEVEYRDLLVVKELSKLSSGGDSTYIAVTYYFYAPKVGFIGCKIDSAESANSIRSHAEISDWFMRRID
ncbi:MAG TPA: hypothetical protein VLM75_06410 [Spirochaetota bacterium]|nr:hypothetical protein [Spirochaetota bacterium]